MYDDHRYCETCRKHSRACWCLDPASGRPAGLLRQDAEEMGDSMCSGGEGHD